MYGTTGYSNPELSGLPRQNFTDAVGSGNSMPAYQGGGSSLSYGNNLNYPTYEGNEGGIMASVDSTANQAGDAAISSGNKYAMAAGAAAKTLGSIAGIYGKYKEREEAKKQYAAKMKIYEAQERERLADKSREAARRSRQEGYFASDFSQGLEDRLAGSYGGYRVGGQ